ncbi:MAG: hypothetical protein KGI54_13330 [Pseudomonadota bacterium]|nr:hypothetical protein [Pseudomonadota bacterium]
MTDTIIAAIITFVGTVSAPLVVIFVQGYSKSSKIVAFKKGFKFKGEWAVDSGGPIIVDEMVVDSTFLGKIKCTGSLNHNGSSKCYSLIGKQYGWCITFEYLGTENGQHDETAGVIIIDKTTPNNMCLNGRWAQLTLDGKLIGGTVTLTRIV